MDDEYVIEQATEMAREFGGVRVSMLQRRLRIGYVQAARCVDIMQERGIIDATKLVAPFGYKYITEANAGTEARGNRVASGALLAEESEKTP